MGAELLVMIAPKGSKEEILDWYQDENHSMAISHGYEYSGTWASKDEGLVFINNVIFDSYEEAEAHIRDGNEKWEKPWAVPFKGYIDTAKMKKLKEELSRLNSEKIFGRSKKISDLTKKLTSEIVNQKSTYKGCSSCGSKLKASLLKDYVCPLCNASLLSNTAQKRLDALKDKMSPEFYNVKIDAIKSELKELEQKEASKSKEIRYVVGGWCPS